MDFAMAAKMAASMDFVMDLMKDFAKDLKMVGKLVIAKVGLMDAE